MITALDHAQLAAPPGTRARAARLLRRGARHDYSEDPAGNRLEFLEPVG
ncbi:hypothetical protein ABZS71_26410 [Streptomyces sp. NPDC005393]